jgi:taurine dioxygenase
VASIVVLPVSGTLGALIDGVDLTRALKPDQISAITTALRAHLVCLFPGQLMSPEQLVAFGTQLPVTDDTGTRRRPIVSEAMVWDSRQTHVNQVGDWHSDGTYNGNPPVYTLLHAQAIPDAGGDTMWASMYRAYETLSPALQDFLSDLTAVHGFPETRFSERGWAQTAQHPVVRVHPETGRRALYVNPLYTTRISELESAESEALLAFLFDHIRRPELACRHRWTPLDLALWDNRCTVHRPVADYDPATGRVMHRLTVHLPGGTAASAG